MTASDTAVPPRTATEPFAFTRDEFWDAAGRAWWMSVLGIAVVTWVAMWPAAGMGLVIATMGGIVLIAPVGLVGMLLFAPLVMLVARSMRAVRVRALHLVVQGSLGLLVGTAVMGILTSVTPRYLLGSWWVAACAAVPALVFPWAWWLAERRARLSDAGLLHPRPRADIDAMVEDAIVDRRDGAH